MNTPFRLDDHKRRPAQPLAPPPADYFERLPRQVMARVQPRAPRESVVLGWLAALPLPLRTVLASAVVLGGFTTSFFLSQPTAGPTAAAPVATLEAVPHTEMVQYLLASDSRITLSDLAELPTAPDRTLTDSFLQASPDELQDALDGQPVDDTYL
ncbi:hypothetical protein [Hymenobacter cellulosivorans]|uniref:Uncharacterized protein n=1 Tax=Hymenobacter cellulosivorans TaxID=2932249 RepID=A0ABY4F6B0_9BACT|nr:hypothetical protein [Hymenobacter cellulosivorans]UOQ52191.1 hypothetical protein MUN80_20815 [Hymenobacter cellulosivorans]